MALATALHCAPRRASAAREAAAAGHRSGSVGPDRDPGPPELSRIGSQLQFHPVWVFVADQGWFADGIRGGRGVLRHPSK